MNILFSENQSLIGLDGRCRYEREAEATFASARLWDDGIIDPADTRRILGLSLAVARNSERVETKYGVFRM